MFALILTIAVTLQELGGELLHRELAEQSGIIDRPTGAVRSLPPFASAPSED